MYFYVILSIFILCYVLSVLCTTVTIKSSRIIILHVNVKWNLYYSFMLNLFVFPYRFPFPGSPNAKSRLRFVEFSLKDELIVNIKISDMLYPWDLHFSWAEYIVRAGM